MESQLSDVDEEEEEEEDDDDDDEEEAADEYDDISGEISDGMEQSEDETEMSMDAREEVLAWRKETKSQRVEKIRNEVKEFGNDIIDVDELASIYDFRIDRFQVCLRIYSYKSSWAFQSSNRPCFVLGFISIFVLGQRLAIKAFLNGSSVVVSAPTSSGKTLIAEAAAVATVARGRRIFYTTPLKALSNQKFRDFRLVVVRSFLGIGGNEREIVTSYDMIISFFFLGNLQGDIWGGQCWSSHWRFCRQ